MLDCKFWVRHKTGLKSTYRRVGKKYIRLVDRCAIILASSIYKSRLPAHYVVYTQTILACHEHGAVVNL